MYTSQLIKNGSVLQVVFHLGPDDFANLTTVFAEEDVRKYILERKNIIVNFVVKIGVSYSMLSFFRSVQFKSRTYQMPLIL